VLDKILHALPGGMEAHRAKLKILQAVIELVTVAMVDRFIRS